MKLKSARRSSLFLMELILAILFFSLAGAVCVLLFATSHTTGKETRELNMAVTQAQSAAEAAAASETGLAGLQKFFDPSILDQDRMVVYYDGEWNLTSEKDAHYEMQITCTEKDRLLKYHIEVCQKDDSSIYELDTAYHTPLTGSQDD